MKIAKIDFTIPILALLVGTLIFGANIYVKKKKEDNYQRLLNLPKSNDVLEVYYEGETPITIDRDIFRIGSYGITVENKIYYFRGYTTIVDGKKRYLTTFSSYGPKIKK